MHVRCDVPTVHKRIDALLTLILDMKTREPVGFTLKGFRNFYLRHFQKKHELLEVEFVRLTSVIEEAWDTRVRRCRF